MAAERDQQRAERDEAEEPRPPGPREGRRGQGQGGQADVERREERVGHVEQRPPRRRREGNVRRQDGQRQLQQVRRVHGPHRAHALRHVPTSGAARRLHDGNPQGRGEAEREGQGQPGRAQGQERRPRGIATAKEGQGVDHRHRGRHRAHVRRSGQDLARERRTPEQGTAHSRRAQRAVRGQDHPGHPRGAREVVPQAHHREQRARAHPDGGGDESGGARQVQDARQQVHPDPGQQQMPHHVEGVDHGGRRQQVEPRPGIQDLGARVGEQRLAERKVRVPQGPRARRDAPHEALDLPVPDAVDVALEEHAAAEEDVLEEED